jgi:hypothetical protein
VKADLDATGPNDPYMLVAPPSEKKDGNFRNSMG